MLLSQSLISKITHAIFVTVDAVNNAANSGNESPVVGHAEESPAKWLVDWSVVIGTPFVILAGLTGLYLAFGWWKASRESKKNTGSLWQFDVKSTGLKPGKGFNIWSFKEAFHDRDSVEKAREKFLDEKKNLILTGRSGLGKTRTAFEILSKSKKKYEILIPFRTRPESFESKSSFKKRKSVILFIDDLQDYDPEDIAFYLDNLVAHSSEVRLLCTCKTEHEVAIYSSFPIPDLERYDIKEWAVSEGRSLASLLNIDFDERAFDRTPASLIYNLDKLKERYKQLAGNEKVILESIKLLKTITLRCNSDEVKGVAENVFELDQEYLSFNNWRDEFKKLETIGFYVVSEQGSVIVNDRYLSDLYELDFFPAFDRYFKYASDNGFDKALVVSGIYLDRRKHFDYAEKCFKEAIKISPKYASPYYRLGSHYLKKAN